MSVTEVSTLTPIHNFHDDMYATVLHIKLVSVLRYIRISVHYNLILPTCGKYTLVLCIQYTLFDMHDNNNKYVYKLYNHLSFFPSFFLVQYCITIPSKDVRRKHMHFCALLHTS